MRRCFGYMAAASLLLGSFALTGSLRAAAEETETIAVEGERSAAEEATSIADADEIGGSGSAAEGAKPADGDTGEASENTAGTADGLPEGISSLELTRLMGNGTNLGNTMEACDNGYRGGNTTEDIAAAYSLAEAEKIWIGQKNRLTILTINCMLRLEI